MLQTNYENYSQINIIIAKIGCFFGVTVLGTITPNEKWQFG